MKKKLSIASIASQLNISTATVSFILNGKAKEKKISEALEKKVIAYVDKVGYRPNRMAQGLRTGKSKIIGMLIEDISDPFFSSIARQVEENAVLNGYHIIYGSTENEPVKTLDLLQIFRHHQVDGYIIAPPPGIESAIRDLVEEGLPVVLFDRKLKELDTDVVEVDNFDGTLSAMEHMIANGFRNIAMITLTSDQNQMNDRVSAYEQAMSDNDLPSLVKKITYHAEREKSVKIIQNFLKLNKNMDAVFFATNYIAINGLEAIKRSHLTIGRDLGVIAFDDSISFELFTPSITAIAQPINDISTAVISKMLERLTSQADDTANIYSTKTLHTVLIERESSAPLRK